MGLFSRRRDDSAEPVETSSEPSGRRTRATRAGRGEADASRTGGSAPQGPWDLGDLPRDQEDVSRLDLGSLRVPAVDGMQLRLEQAPGGAVTAAVLTLSGSSLELRAFAAPKSSGIWEELRADIAQSLSGARARYQEIDGEYGTEILAQIPVRAPDGTVSASTVRFIGIEGPRWFLRGALQGPAASSSEAATALREVLRSVVVVRDGQARPPREVLPLHAPGAAAAPEAEDLPGLDPLTPGPTIAEVR